MLFTLNKWKYLLKINLIKHFSSSHISASIKHENMLMFSERKDFYDIISNGT